MDSNTRMTQTDRIFRHMSDYGSITAIEAMNEYGIMRLAARIADLSKMGFMIKREMVDAKNRYGEKVRYARYSFSNEADMPTWAEEG